MADREQGAAAPMAWPSGKSVNRPPKMSPKTAACSTFSPAAVQDQLQPRDPAFEGLRLWTGIQLTEPAGSWLDAKVLLDSRLVLAQCFRDGVLSWGMRPFKLRCR